MRTATRAPPRFARVTSRPVLLVLVGIISVQLGAAVAKDLFTVVPPTAVVLLRLVTSAVLLVAIARPVLRGRTRQDWLVVAGFGVSLGAMNWAIYESFARIPLGVAVTIEFIGPLALAVIGSRRPRDLAWVVLAGGGVLLLGFERTSLDPVGVAFAVLAGVSWASYILLSASTGRRWPGLYGLAVASVVATVLVAGPGIALAGSDLLDTRVLVIGALVGVFSSVIPYSCEMVALRSLRPSTFGILMSLEPAAAALAALVVLRELLTPLQWLAMGLVVAASIGATRSGATTALSEPVPD